MLKCLRRCQMVAAPCLSSHKSPNWVTATVGKDTKLLYWPVLWEIYSTCFCCDTRTHADGGGSLVVFHIAVKPPPNRRSDEIGSGSKAVNGLERNVPNGSFTTRVAKCHIFYTHGCCHFSFVFCLARGTPRARITASWEVVSAGKLLPPIDR